MYVLEGDNLHFDSLRTLYFGFIIDMRVIMWSDVEERGLDSKFVFLFTKKGSTQVNRLLCNHFYCY